MIYKKSSDEFLRIKQGSVVFYFSNGPYVFIEEGGLDGDYSHVLTVFIPSSDESNTMMNEYQVWCEQTSQPQNSELIACLNDFELYKPDLLNLVDKLSAAFEDNLNKDMFFTSLLGFKVNGDRRTKSNLQDIITFFDLQAKEGKISYRDYDNVSRELTKEQVQTLLIEHVANGNGLYEQKWTYQQLINNAASLDDLANIKIEFRMMDFTNAQP